MSDFISPAKAAKILSVHPETLRRRTDVAGLTVARTAGGHRRYVQSEIEQLRENVARGIWALETQAPAPTTRQMLQDKFAAAVSPAEKEAARVRAQWNALPQLSRSLLLIARSIAGWWGLGYVGASVAFHLTAKLMVAMNPFKPVLIERFGSHGAVVDHTYSVFFDGPLQGCWWLCAVVTAMLCIKALVHIADAVLGHAHRNRHGHSHGHA